MSNTMGKKRKERILFSKAERNSYTYVQHTSYNSANGGGDDVFFAS
jgi:hypothetical protein